MHLLGVNVEGNRWSEKPKKRWLGAIENDMRTAGV